MCKDVFVANYNENKNFAKVKSNLSLYFENLGTAIFKEHLHNEEFPS